MMMRLSLSLAASPRLEASFSSLLLHLLREMDPERERNKKRERERKMKRAEMALSKSNLSSELARRV